MQRVFRFSLIGLLGVASLTACGDKVNVVGPTTNAADNQVHGVTVTPPNATMAIGDKLTFIAAVNAGPAVTDKTVTWSSSNSAVASVDATGVVTAKAAGTTSIIATSNADKTQAAAATVTVGATTPTTITVSSINQTICGFGGCSSAPANLANIVGQLDVILNVDPGSAKLNEVDLIMNCTGPGNTGTDTIVAKQTTASSNLAPSAEEASAPITLSFNTATFNTTSGVPAFKNGNCTIKAQAITQSGTGTPQTTKSTDLVAVLNNPDVVIGTIASGKNALNPVTGLAWNGQSVTVSATPVFFTPNRTAVSQTITYEGKSATLTGAGTQSVTFKDDNDPAILAAASDPLNIDQITDANSQNTLTVTVVDNSGQNFANAAGTPIATAASFFASPNNPLPPWLTQNNIVNPFRLDTKKPVSGTLILAGNVQQNVGNFFINTAAYLNGSFKFQSDSASGYQGADFLSGVAGCPVGTVVTRAGNCDFGGVDSVTVVFQTATSSTGTYTTVTNPSSLAESNTNTAYFLRQITTDRLGNADTTFSCGVASYTVGVGCTQYSAVASGAASAPTSARFGVDKTAPTLALSSGEADKNTYQAAGAAGNYNLSALDVGTIGGAGIGTYGGPGSLLVAQTRLYNDLNPATVDLSGFEGQVVSTNANAALTGGIYVGATPLTISGIVDPCVIGRFNGTAAKAGPNALTVFWRDGTTAGFCTPVAYTPTAGPSNTSAVPAAAISALGYFKTQVIATDLANNVATTTFTATVLEDNSLPTITSVDLPQTLAGGTTVSFPAGASDNTAAAVGDITGSWATLTYSVTGFVLQYPVSTAGAGTAFDNVLTRSATITPPVQNFIKNLQVSTGGTTAPTSTSSTTTAGAAGAPSTLTISAIDAANNVSVNATGTVNLSAVPVQITGSGTNFTAAGSGATFFTGGFSIAASTANVSNCPAAGCGPSGSTAAANPTSTVITATANGTSGAFNNPFSAGTLQLWYRPTGTTTWFLAPSSDVSVGTVSFADNGTSRQWIYNLTWNPPAATPVSALGAPQNLSPANAATINVDVMVVGVNGNGDGVATPVQVITLTNP
jgi:hypothetical protein